MSSPRSLGSSEGFDPAGDTLLEERPYDYDLDNSDRDRTQVEETQFVDVEIDTQATAGYDLHDDLQSTQPASPAFSMMAKPKEFAVSYDDDKEIAPGFAFSKANMKTPAISIPRKGAAQARGSSKEVTQAPTIEHSHPPKNSPQTIEEEADKPAQPFPPKAARREPLFTDDPNRQINHNLNNCGEDGGTKLAEAMHAAANTPTTESSKQPASLPTSAMLTTQPVPFRPPFTQAAPQKASRKPRRKKTAPAAMLHNISPQPSQSRGQHGEVTAAFSSAPSDSQQYSQAPLYKSVEEDNSQSPPPRNLDFNTSFMAQVDEKGHHSAPVQHIVDQRGAPRDVSYNALGVCMPTGGVVQPRTAHSSPSEPAAATERAVAPMQRPGQARPKKVAITSLPFPEAAGLSTRKSPMPVNRPLATNDIQVSSANGPRTVSVTGKVTKRKRPAPGTVSSGRAQGGDAMVDVRLQNRLAEPMRRGDTPAAEITEGVVESDGNNVQRGEHVRPQAPMVHATLDLNAGLDLFDRAKNALTAQVFEKDRELAHLKAEMDRLVQTVQNLEGDVSRLEGDKKKLREDMFQKCESLKTKVGELLKDHKAVGGFIEKTNNDIAKCNKYKEKSGSIFKEAITKYADLQQHQKRTIEAIQDARMHVAHDLADLKRAHNHESGIVLKDLQFEKKKVSELEKALDSEKQKVMHLETRLDANLQDSIKEMFEKQNDSLAAKVENGGKELLEAINTKQEEKTASLKDYLKTLQAYKEHETDASKAIGELLSQVTALSANVSEALKSKDTAQDELHKAGTQILNSIKEKVESISESHSNQTELANRVLNLETSKINLECQLKSHTQANLNLQSQLEAKNAELEQNLRQLQLKDQELKSLQSSIEQETARNQQEADTLRSSLTTVKEELEELKGIQTQLQEDNQSLLAQTSHLKDEVQSASERLRRAQESDLQNAEILKASEDDNARVLRRAEAAEAKMAELQAKLTEQATSAKQQLEGQRIKMEEDKRRAQQGTKGELSTLKKRYEKLETENSSLKDVIAAHTDPGPMKQELARLERENSYLIKSHASELQKYQNFMNSYVREIQAIKAEHAAQVVQAGEDREWLKQMGRFKEKFEAAIGKMESRLLYHEAIETKIRAYCDQRGWNYDEMDVETFFYQISTSAIEGYRQSLNSSSFSTHHPRPSLSFGQSMTAAAEAGSQVQHSQSSATRHRRESITEIVQVAGTPRVGRRSPSMPSMASHSPSAAMVSPPRARRNHSIAERRRNQAAVPKPQSPDPASTPVRKPTDRTTGTGGRGPRSIPTPLASNLFEIPDNSQGASQRRSVGRLNSGAVPKAFTTLSGPSAGDDAGNLKLDSEFSDLSDIMDMMDQNPDVDPIPVLELQRRERASSTVEDKQSQRGKASAMEPPTTPSGPAESQSQESKPLKSILKKRTHSTSQEVAETPSQAPARRKQLQPVKGKNSLASLGTGVAGFRSSQEAGSSRAVDFRATEDSVVQSNTAAVEVETATSAINIGSKAKRTKTMKGGSVESQTRAMPVVRKARMSIPYKPTAKPSSSRK